MNRASAVLRLAVSALLFALPAAASWQDIPPADFPMASPPAPGTPESDRDYAELLKLQASRKPEECSTAAAQAIPDFQSLFGGSGLLAKPELAAVAPFIDAASKFVSKITGYYKKLYARPRPYSVDARVQPCIEKPAGATSYPSTHAAAGVFDACVLGQLFPLRANALASYGKSVGDLRVIAGVHHPSDVAAGQDMGARICARLLKEADFQAELAQVKKTLP